MTTIAQAFERPTNQFTLVRLVAAAAVIVSHAYLVTTGDHAAEPLMRSTGFTLGQHAVNVFFGMSGFLVMASWDRRPSPVSFLTARLLRIFPALIVAAATLVMLVGPILTGRNPLEYASSRDALAYLLRTVFLLDGNAYLPGAFDNLPVPGETTITVWTLKYELACYFGLLGLGVVGLAARRWMVGTLAALGLLLALTLSLRPDVAAIHSGIHHTVRFSACFWLGMAAWRFRDMVPIDWRLGGALALIAALAVGTPASDALIYLAEVYGALVIALGASPIALTEIQFDLSYGLYLYGYPVEQAMVRYLPDISAPVLAAAALVATAVIAAASWRYVERPAIRAKHEAAVLLARALHWTRRTALGRLQRSRFG